MQEPDFRGTSQVNYMSIHNVFNSLNGEFIINEVHFRDVAAKFRNI